MSDGKPVPPLPDIAPSERDATLQRFGLTDTDLIGAGSESWVYALDRDRILRIRRRPDADRQSVERLARFLDSIAGRLPFATPRIEAIEADGVTIERRLPGRTMTERLPALGGDGRRLALDHYFDAAIAVGAIGLAEEPYGLLLASDPVTAGDWPGFFMASLDQHVARIRPDFDSSIGDLDRLAANARALFADVPRTPRKVLAHGDIFPGNLLMDDALNVTALVDFGAWTLVAEPLYDAAAAVMFAEIAEGIDTADNHRLRSRLIDHAGPAAVATMTAYRAYFAFTLHDPHANGLYPRLQPWSINALKQIGDGNLGDWARLPR